VEPRPLEPVSETAELLELLGPAAHQVRSYLDHIVTRVRTRVPELMAVSLSLLDEETVLTFTLAISDDRLRGLDAAQYLQDGPCVQAVRSDEVITTDVEDPLDERRWSLFARSAARFGVRSSLSIPVRRRGTTVGGLNVYASANDGFRGHVDVIAELVQASPAEAISDADLSFSALERARESLFQVQDLETLDVAAGLLAEREEISEDEAVRRIEDAARRAGVTPVELALLVIEVVADDE
jgi:GAF domain-containing protein